MKFRSRFCYKFRSQETASSSRTFFPPCLSIIVPHMAFLPLHRDKEHKFKNGSWTWSEHESALKFHPHDGDKKTKNRPDGGLKFKELIGASEEKIFREVFQRPNCFYDSEVVTLQDIKNLVLFTMNSSMTRKFVEFVHLPLFDKFLRSIIVYVDAFLMVLEYLLIRRDKATEGKVRDTFSIKVEQFLSKQLSDRRLMIAREYSKV
jgi:Protein phosphatase 1 inhibitor